MAVGRVVIPTPFLNSVELADARQNTANRGADLAFRQPAVRISAARRTTQPQFQVRRVPATIHFRDFPSHARRTE